MFFCDQFQNKNNDPIKIKQRSIDVVLITFIDQMNVYLRFHNTDAPLRNDASALKNMPTGEEMQIKRSIEKIPGGMMLVPHSLAHCATPSRRGRGNILDHHQRDDYRYGAHSGGVVFLHGASIKLSATGTVLRKSGTLVEQKLPSRGWLRQLPRALFRNWC